MGMRKNIFVLVLVVLAGYAGFVVGEQKLRVEIRNWKLEVSNQEVPKNRTADFSLFWQVWDRLEENYVDKGALDGQKMVDGAISGMVSSLGDPYTVFLPLTQNKEAKEELNGSFEGVGIQLGFKDKRLVVIAPLDGTPAYNAGVKAGDLIDRIQDEAKKVDRQTDGLALPEAVSLIRGPKGTPVVLTLVREGKDEPFEVKLLRDTIVVKSVTVEIKDNVAHLKLNRFGDRTQDEWSTAVGQIVSKNVKGIVLDLRNNPGGYLDGAVWIAGEFLPAGKLVVTQQYGDGTKTDLKVSRNGRLLKNKLVVLVNEGSASAAEILAGAIQDYKRAKIIGVKSFGKGSVQQPDDFPDGSGIHITIARWLRPSGEWIDKKGIIPDVEIKAETATDSSQLQEDIQLKKAIEML